MVGWHPVVTYPLLDSQDEVAAAVVPQELAIQSASRESLLRVNVPVTGK